MSSSRVSLLSVISISVLGFWAMGCDPSAVPLLAGGPEGLDKYLDMEMPIGGGPEGIVLEQVDFDTQKIWNAFTPLWLFSPPK